MHAQITTLMTAAASAAAATVKTPAEHIAWWEGAGGAIVGGLIGAVIAGWIPLAWAKWARRIERRGELTAMQVELDSAWIGMTAMREGGIWAPLYRMPLTEFGRALPKLIGEGKLTQDEIRALVEYVIRLEEINRGLDRAGEAQSAEDAKLEFSRNLEKLKPILDTREWGRGDTMTLFGIAESAIYRLTGDSPPDRLKMTRLNQQVRAREASQHGY